MELNYGILEVGGIVLLPFLAFVINSFIVKKFTKLAVTLSCGAIFGSFLLSARIFSDFTFKTYSAGYYVHKYFTWFDLNSSLGKPFLVNMGI